MINHGNSRLQNLCNGIRYRQQKKEVEQIVRRLDKKRSMQILIQRSEGSLIQREISNRRKTQIKMQQELKRKKRKQMLAKRKTFSFNPIGEHIKSQKRHASETPKKLSQMIEKERMINQMKQCTVDPETMTVCIKDQINPFSDLENSNLISNKSQNPKKLGLRPLLQELQEYLQEQNPKILQRRRKIVEMLILCLLRRCHQKLYEALDIGLEISSFFQDGDNETILKCISMRLIGKIYKEISIQQKKKRVSLESKLNQKSVRDLTKKRHSSIMIKTLASQRVFFTRFAHKYRKSKLLKQTSYRREEDKLKEESSFNIYDGTDDKIKERQQEVQGIQGQDNKRMSNTQLITEQKKGTKLFIKLNSKFAINLPAPSHIFPAINPPCQNYSIVLHQRDIESTNKLFPYQYPYCIQKHMNKKQYSFLISSINSVIFSQTQCYSFLQVFKTFITLLTAIILILIVLIFYLLQFQERQVIDWILVSVMMLVFTGVMVLLANKNATNIYVTKQRRENMVKQLKKWNLRHQKHNIVFKITQNCEALIICWPINYDENLQTQSSIDQTDSINEESSSSKGSSLDETDEEQDNTLMNEISSSDSVGEKDQVLLPEQRDSNFKVSGKKISFEEQLQRAKQQEKDKNVNTKKCVQFSSRVIKEQRDSSQLYELELIPVENSIHQIKSDTGFPHRLDTLEIKDISISHHVPSQQIQNLIKKSTRSLKTILKNQTYTNECLDSDQDGKIRKPLEVNQNFREEQEIETVLQSKKKKPKIEPKPIQDIIQVGDSVGLQYKQFDPQTGENLRQDPEGMCLEVIEKSEKKIYNFKYYLTEDDDQSQSHQSVRLTDSQIPAQNIQPLTDRKHDSNNLQSLLDKQYLCDLLQDSDEEDEVIESFNSLPNRYS